MNNYIYIHVCCINNWKEIFNKLLFDIKESGLYNKIKTIKCNILKENKDIEMDIFKDNKIEIIGITNDINLYEKVTLNALHEHALVEDFNVLYLHTKGVKHNNGNINVTDWVKYLSYFNIYKHEICIEKIAEYDTVGVNLQENPSIHYSGNFWWSKSQYIRKLEKCNNENYNSPEFWLTEKKIGKYLSLYSSNINHYHERYEEDNYVNKPVRIKEIVEKYKTTKSLSFTPPKAESIIQR